MIMFNIGIILIKLGHMGRSSPMKPKMHWEVLGSDYRHIKKQNIWVVIIGS